MKDLSAHLQRTRGRRAAVELTAVVALAFIAAPVSGCLRRTAPPAVAAQPPVQPVQMGKASYYARGLSGRRTASGEPHDPRALTAASPTLPLGSTAKVTNTDNGKSVVVQIDDRGPHAKGRILDVSRNAADHLALKSKGVADVAVQPLSP